MVYRHAIQNNANYKLEADVTYAVNNNLNIADGSFARVGCAGQYGQCLIATCLPAVALSCRARHAPHTLTTCDDCNGRLSFE